MERVQLLQRVLNDFIKHAEDLKNEDDPAGDGFYREFKILRDLSMKMRDEETYLMEEGKKPHNVKKNRYKDILPFDATRVVLEEIPGEPGSDYINANFIKNQYQNICCIATQGPVQGTVYDFWRMIVLYKVKIITMACKLVEMGKKKCEQYWPSEVNETVEYKDISVKLMAEEVMAKHCTKRFLKVARNGNVSMVTQFHYMGWPDHDIPNDFNDILEMMAEMRKIKAADIDKAPMVIHCSAGCGRTGTICAIDYAWDILNIGNLTADFSLFEIVKEMRTQRQSMIQAPEQYMMAHIMVKKLFQMHLDMMEDHIYSNVDIDKQVDESDQLKGEVNDSSVKQHPQKNSSLQNEIEQTIKLVTGAPNLHTVVEKQELLQPQLEQKQKLEQKLEPVISKAAKDTVTVFKVEKIESIPQSHKVAYESGMWNKTCNYISSNNGKKDLKVEMALSDNFNPLLESKYSFGLDSSISRVSVEPNRIAAVATESSLKSQKYQRIESQQEKSGKFKTIISVGSVIKKQPVKKSLSTPVETATIAHRNSAFKTLSINSSDLWFSSVPNTLPEQSCDKYSLVHYTSSVESKHSAYSNPSAASLNDHVHGAEYQNPFSVADDSSVKGASKYVGSLQECEPYSSVDLDFATPVDNQRVNTSSDKDVPYSVANDTGDSNGHPDGLYSTVETPLGSLSKPIASDYEAIAYGDKVMRQPPPPIPERNYEEPSVDTAGSGKSAMPSKKIDGGSVKTTLFSQKKATNGPGSSEQQHSLVAAIGFKKKVEKKPEGPKPHPKELQKK